MPELRVLIVEDELLVRQSPADELEQAGYVVAQAASAEEALALVEAAAGLLDVLVTDIQLAGTLTGWDLAEAIHAGNSSVHVVYTSARPPEPHRRLPGSTFLAKPCQPHQVARACRLKERPHESS